MRDSRHRDFATGSQLSSLAAQQLSDSVQYLSTFSTYLHFVFTSLTVHIIIFQMPE